MRLLARAAALLAVVVAAQAQAAAPNVILVSGRGLDHPVLLADWQQNLRILLAVANAPRAPAAVVAALPRRPRLDLAEFWAWSGRPRPTTPAGASQHGSFYPARAGSRAVVTLTVQGVRVPRFAPPLLLRVLAAGGVPVRLRP